MRSITGLRKQKIDMVKVDGFYLFVYTQDWFHQARSTKETRGKTYKDLVKEKNAYKFTPTDSVSNYISSWNKENPLDNLILALLYEASNNKRITLVDVGCLYGLVSLNYAEFCRRYGVATSHICFDPGLGGDLAGSNFKNNGYEDIKFFPYAVSEYNGYVRLNYEIGNNEDNRIVNPKKTGRSFNRIVRSVSLDKFLGENDDSEHIFIKIDTQGAECDVFAGLEKTLKNKSVAGIFEYAPCCLPSKTSAIALLEKLGGEFDLFDVGARRDRVIKINIGNEEKVYQRAISGNYAWTDIVFAQKCLNIVKYLN